ncbi:hypothetical protein SLA2020_400780 [Shorea laevis]
MHRRALNHFHLNDDQNLRGRVWLHAASVNKAYSFLELPVHTFQTCFCVFHDPHMEEAMQGKAVSPVVAAMAEVKLEPPITIKLEGKEQSIKIKTNA